jgi:hypothetical protein
MKGSERFVGVRFTMAACMQCHQQKGGNNACQTCHREIRAELAPPSHQTNWRADHGKLGGTAQDRAEQHCDLCHADQAFCTECHAKTPPASHKHLWKERHGALAANDRAKAEAHCDMCHDDQIFCDRCHREEKPRSHDTMWRLKTHGVMAAMDRKSCAPCHETDYCVRCHEETAPLSHRGRWTANPATHCGECHFPISREQNCRVCHFEEPQHETATDQPAWHVPGMNCRTCHLPAGPGPGGAPPVPHIDNGSECQHCQSLTGALLTSSGPRSPSGLRPGSFLVETDACTGPVGFRSPGERSPPVGAPPHPRRRAPRRGPGACA